MKKVLVILGSVLVVLLIGCTNEQEAEFYEPEPDAYVPEVIDETNIYEISKPEIYYPLVGSWQNLGIVFYSHQKNEWLLEQRHTSLWTNFNEDGTFFRSMRGDEHTWSVVDGMLIQNFSDGENFGPATFEIVGDYLFIDIPSTTYARIKYLRSDVRVERTFNSPWNHPIVGTWVLVDFTFNYHNGETREVIPPWIGEFYSIEDVVPIHFLNGGTVMVGPLWGHWHVSDVSDDRIWWLGNLGGYYSLSDGKLTFTQYVDEGVIRKTLIPRPPMTPFEIMVQDLITDAEQRPNQGQHPFAFVLQSMIDILDDEVTAFLVDVDGRGTEGMLVRRAVGEWGLPQGTLFYLYNGVLGTREFGGVTRTLMENNRVVSMWGDGGVVQFTLFAFEDGRLVEELVLYSHLGTYRLNRQPITEAEFHEIHTKYGFDRDYMRGRSDEELTTETRYILSMTVN